ncbi:hypothetical protein EOL70_05575 [Leucothrix sargassi]|nr:hypothetical protein EOL70_05575 [Leucothrix sargassi]
MLLPANGLEQALHQAAIDEAKVEDFYKLMMESRVFILGTPAGDVKDPEFVLTEDDELMINHWESDEDKSPVIPFFTSLQTLQKVIPEDEPYLEVPTEALFRMTLGIPMVLNPNTDFGMEFSPEDVVSLLGSDTVNNAEGLLDGEYDENGVYLDTLAKQPEKLVETISEILKDYDDVNMAYLAVIHEPSEDPEPHLLVGILGSSTDMDETIAAIAERITEDDNDSPFEMFDFFTINDDDPDISNFLTEHVEPFYRSAANKLH